MSGLLIALGFAVAGVLFGTVLGLLNMPKHTHKIENTDTRKIEFRGSQRQCLDYLKEKGFRGNYSMTQIND